MEMVSVKTIFIFLICLFAAGWISSCANNDKFYEGMYESTNQMQKMNAPEAIIPPEEEPPSYSRYKQERREMIAE